MPDEQLPALVFGLAQRAAQIADGPVTYWNIIGLRSVFFAVVFPMQMPPWHLAIAMPSGGFTQDLRFVFVDDLGKEIGVIQIAHAETLEGHEPPPVSSGRFIQVARDGWTLLFMPIQGSPIVVEHPGVVQVRAGSRDGPVLGTLVFGLAEPFPLTPERIAALRADPNTRKGVRVVFGCKSCDAKVRAYAALGRDEEQEREGWVWYENLPDVFKCACGATAMPLDIARRNLHGLLGPRDSITEGAEFMPLYEKTSLAQVRAQYARLLDEKPREEVLQVFLAENPVLLHIFSAVRLFIKPPILTRFVADFAIITPKKELLFIEIEKTTTRLLKKDGGIAADLSHAFDQVRSWLSVVAEHRLAVLDSLGIDRMEVSTVRGIVIAGRDVGADSAHLRHLKGQDWGPLNLYTFDDLLFALDSLIEQMQKM